VTALSPRQMFLLDVACAPMLEWVGRGGIYLVGTAAAGRVQGQTPRDVDVRMILPDKRHDRLRKAIGAEGIAFLGIAIGQYLASITGLPIDFQIQRQTEANALHKGTRNALGHRSMGNYRGDAQTVDMEKMRADLEAQNPSDVLWKPGVKGLCYICRCLGYHAIGCTAEAAPVQTVTAPAGHQPIVISTGDGT
jgi:hypothetical protein